MMSGTEDEAFDFSWSGRLLPSGERTSRHTKDEVLEALHALSPGDSFPYCVTVKGSSDTRRWEYVAILSSFSAQDLLDQSQVFSNVIFKCPCDWESGVREALANREPVCDTIRLRTVVFVSEFPPMAGCDRRLTVDPNRRVGQMVLRVRPQSFLLWGTRYISFGPPPSDATDHLPLTMQQMHDFAVWATRPRRQIYVGGLACTTGTNDYIRHFAASFDQAAFSSALPIDSFSLAISSWFRGTGAIPLAGVSLLQWKPLNFLSSEEDKAVVALSDWIFSVGREHLQSSIEESFDDGVPSRPVAFFYEDLISSDEIVRNELAFLRDPRTQSWTLIEGPLEASQGEWFGEPAQGGLEFVDHRGLTSSIRQRLIAEGRGSSYTSGYPVEVPSAPRVLTVGDLRSDPSASPSRVVRPPRVDVSGEIRRDLLSSASLRSSRPSLTEAESDPSEGLQGGRTFF